LAGYLFCWRKKVPMAAVGEIIGTGLIAPVVCALWVAPVFMGKAIPLLALVPSFLASTIAGALLGVLALKFLQRADIVDIGGP
ncbi:MAG: energy coupling factor transporter S component ThiW, partial [Desulfosarcina sp.]|nr:energy coupling factor transporter S component ThiW [Desulfobacterales bacterium]